jgi:hypothetical protein
MPRSGVLQDDGKKKDAPRFLRIRRDTGATPGSRRGPCARHHLSRAHARKLQVAAPLLGAGSTGMAGSPRAAPSAGGCPPSGEDAAMGIDVQHPSCPLLRTAAGSSSCPIAFVPPWRKGNTCIQRRPRIPAPPLVLPSSCSAPRATGTGEGEREPAGLDAGGCAPELVGGSAGERPPDPPPPPPLQRAVDRVRTGYSASWTRPHLQIAAARPPRRRRPSSNQRSVAPGCCRRGAP